MTRPAPALHYFDEDESAATSLALALGVSATPIRVHRFPDGESLPRVDRPGPLAIVHCTLDRPDGKLFPLALAADALRRSGAERIVLVAPYLSYMRQDMAFAPGEPVSQRVIADFLRRSFDRIVTVDAHLHRTRSLDDLFAPAEADDLASTEALAAWIGTSGWAPDLIVGPDEESEPWVRAIAGTTGASWLTMRKDRHGDATVEVRLADRSAPVSGRRILLVDDICSSGGTVRQAVRTLKAAGAAEVMAYVTHALFGQEVGAGIVQAGAAGVVSSDSVTHPSNAVRLRDVIATALRKEPMLDPTGRRQAG